MSKIPAFQFYPADWRKDLGVQSLSYHDRGVWFEMLCLMHESESRGKLILNGSAMTEDVLSRLLGLDKQILTITLTMLLTSGVASLDPESGAIVSRRMVKDENIRKIRAAAGKMGGNPALLNQTSNQKPTTPPKQKPTPSSSSSPSVEDTPPRAREESPTSPGAKGEFHAAYWLQQELGMAATSGDIQVLAQVVQFVARDLSFDEPMEAGEWLLREAKAAEARGQPVNLFWFKDAKYKQPNGGTHAGNRSQQRTNGNLAALAAVRAERRDRELTRDPGGVPSGFDQSRNLETLFLPPGEVHR